VGVRRLRQRVFAGGPERSVAVPHPPPGYSTGATPVGTASAPECGYSPSQVVMMPQLYLLWLQLFVSVISGVTLISNAVFILAELTKRAT
jgi:hypothetical protein